MKTKKEGKIKYYSLTNILSMNAIYNVIVGERSNGKTYSVEEYGLKEFCEKGHQMAIVRRWREDFVGKNGSAMFSALVANNLPAKFTDGQWTDIYYQASRWYLCKWDDKLNKRILQEKPFAYGFAISSGEHDKSTSYPDIKTILFDEFITRRAYIPDEFIEFQNILSTIIRERDDVKIFMLGNTVNQFSPYFSEMGLTNITKMKQGTIDLYTYGTSELTVAVEYCASNKQGKKSDKYFAFDNPKLNMITSGAWELAIYPHLPYKYKSNEIEFTYFIEFYNNILQCEIINSQGNVFTYIHRKTTPLKYDYNDIVFTCSYNPSYLVRRKLTKPFDDIGKKIYYFFKTDKVFYQDNNIGEIVRNYLQWSDTDRGIL